MLICRNLCLLRCLQILVLVSNVVPSALAQTAAPGPMPVGDTKPLAYDVATIRPNRSGSGNSGINWGSNKYAATNASLKILLSNAYGIKEDYIYGLSGPVTSMRFDLEAKILDSDPKVFERLTSKQRQELMQPVLAERFQLRAHTETRTLPIYEIVVAKGGPKLRPTSPPDPDGARGGWGSGNGNLTAHSASMATLASILSDQLHRTVVDKTGIAGRFDIELKWTYEGAADATPEDSAASLLTALQDQLGLKLQSAKGPVEVLVVDHVEMPTEN